MITHFDQFTLSNNYDYSLLLVGRREKLIDFVENSSLILLGFGICNLSIGGAFDFIVLGETRNPVEEKSPLKPIRLFLSLVLRHTHTQPPVCLPKSINNSTRVNRRSSLLSTHANIQSEPPFFTFRRLTLIYISDPLILPFSPPDTDST